MRAIAICEADTSSQLLLKAEDVLRAESLLTEREFVGADGKALPTEQAWAFTVIVRLSERPAVVFRRLAETGSVYGLIGCRKLAPESFREVASNFRGAEDIYIVSHDFFTIEKIEQFIERLARDDSGVIFQRLLWPDIPDLLKTTRVRKPGNN